MNAKSFHVTAQGASHIKKKKECQDYSSSYQDENCTIAIVCDGHGGDDYVRSAIGSKIGCGVAEKNIKKFFYEIDKGTFFSNPDKLLKNLEASIINGWNESINTYHSTNPFRASELSVVSEKARKKYVEDKKIWSAYGTTLIAVAMGHDFWFGIHIGDGKCVAINPAGEFKQPIPWDPKCFLNATTSICDSDAIERFRHFYSQKLPAAVFVGSDGIDDCFSNNEQLHNLYKTVLYSFATTDFKEACEGLADYLPRLSAKGSGDDVSVAALLDLDMISELSIVKEYDREKEKARVEENARKEAEKNEAEKRRVEEEHARFQQQNNARFRRSAQGSAPKFCETCGMRIRPGANFCSNCGSKINYNKVPEQVPAKQQGLQVTNISIFSSELGRETSERIDEEAAAKKAVILNTAGTVANVENEKSVPAVSVTSDNSADIVKDDAADSALIREEVVNNENSEEENEGISVDKEVIVSDSENTKEGEVSDSGEKYPGADPSGNVIEKDDSPVLAAGVQTENQDASKDDELENEKTLEQETAI